MIKIKIFGKFKILTPLIFGPPKNFGFWKTLLHCSPVPNLVKFRQRVSELEGIRLENGIVPCGHNFDLSGSSLTWHVNHTSAHLPWKFGFSDSPGLGATRSKQRNNQNQNFQKNQNFDPPNFPTPLNSSALKDLVTLHPCTKFGVARSKGVGARGHKAGKWNRALRA